MTTPLSNEMLDAQLRNYFGEDAGLFNRVEAIDPDLDLLALGIYIKDSMGTPLEDHVRRDFKAFSHQDSSNIYHALNYVLTSPAAQAKLQYHDLTDARARAETIRDYYTNKLIMLKMHGKELSDFQQKLLDYLYMESNKFNTNWLRMMVVLPDFWSDDTRIDELSDLCDSAVDKEINVTSMPLDYHTSTRMRKSNSFDDTRLWFATPDQHLVRLDMCSKDPLVPMLYSVMAGPGQLLMEPCNLTRIPLHQTEYNIYVPSNYYALKINY